MERFRKKHQAISTQRMWPAQRVFSSSSHWIRRRLQIISSFLFTLKVDIAAQQAQSSYTPIPPLLDAEWAVLHNTAPIIHRAAKTTIHSHQFSPRELWSRCMDQITSAILDSLTVGRTAKCCWLACTCSSCLRQKEIIIASNTVKNICICTCFTCLCLCHLEFTLWRSII